MKLTRTAKPGACVVPIAVQIGIAALSGTVGGGAGFGPAFSAGLDVSSVGTAEDNSFQTSVSARTINVDKTGQATIDPSVESAVGSSVWSASIGCACVRKLTRIRPAVWINTSVRRPRVDASCVDSSVGSANWATCRQERQEREEPTVATHGLYRLSTKSHATAEWPDGNLGVPPSPFPNRKPMR